MLTAPTVTIICVTVLHDYREELNEVREEILSLSEKYSIKCVEAASLEEKCRLATHQLKHYQQHVQQLESRNKQLRAHLASEESDQSFRQDHSSKESTPSSKAEVNSN